VFESEIHADGNFFRENMGMEIILEKLQETQPCANVESRTSQQHLFWP
jgi:hypothetical protein